MAYEFKKLNIDTNAIDTSNGYAFYKLTTEQPTPVNFNPTQCVNLNKTMYAQDYLGTSSMIGEKLYIFGGAGENGQKIQMYNASNNTYYYAGLLPSQLQNSSSCAVGNYIYIFGGATDSYCAGEIYKFDTTCMYTSELNATWEYAYGATVNINNDIYLFGGRDRYGVINKIAKYNIASDTLTNMNAVLPDSPIVTFAIYYNNYVYIACNIGSTTKVFKYDIANDSITTYYSGADETLSEFTSSCVINDELYFIGTYTSGYKGIKKYSPVTNTFTSFNFELASAVVTPYLGYYNNALYVVDGYSNTTQKIY